MIKNNRNNEQIYGRNDMIMLDPNNKIYGSLGIADNYVMKTEEGTRLTLNNPKLGSFDDVLTEFNIYGMSKQESTTGANLIDIDNMLNECLVKNADDTYSILKTETNRFSKKFPINLKAGTAVRFDADVIEYNGTYSIKLQVDFGGGQQVSKGGLIFLKNDVTGVTIYQDSNNDVGTYTKFKNAILSVGEAKVPYEPYTGGKPSPSPEYPQEIKSVVNPTVKVTNEDGLKVQSVTLNDITLNAIPVSSGGNVTINGQQYVADYVDVERGKVVRCVKREPLSKNGRLSSSSVPFYTYNLPSAKPKTITEVFALCNLAQFNSIMTSNSQIGISSDGSNSLRMRLDGYATLEQYTRLSAEIIYELATPIEEDLTSEQITAFKELVTYYPVTIVENNYNTWMKATYKSMESV